MIENFTESQYDALEVQFRTRVRGTDSVQVSYTLSRTLPERRHPLRQLPRHAADAAGTGLQRPGYPPQPVGGRLDVAAVELRPERRVPGAERRAVQRPGRVRRRRRRTDAGRSPGRSADHRRPRGRRRVADDHQRAAGVAQPGAGERRPAEARTRTCRSTCGSPRRSRSPPAASCSCSPRPTTSTNIVNFQSTPNGNINSTSFLVRSTAADARQIQFGARFVF